tara:strand:- start:2202 stop:6914 length:4713 start_codon:yes stop_codon:yes gene_type:complete
MQLLAIAVLFVVGLIGFFIAYMTSQSNSDETIVIANFNKLVSDVLDSLFVLVDTVRGLIQSTVLFIVGNLSVLLILGVVVTIAILVHNESERILETLDRFIRRILYPAMKVGLWQTLHLLKFVYGTFIPLYNFAVVVATQLTTGIATIIAKCSARHFIESMNLLAQGVIYFFEAILGFLQVGVFESDFNITDSVYSVQLAVVEQEHSIACLCRQLSPVAQIALASAKPVAFAQATNALLNIFVSAAQEPVRIFTNASFPDFKRTYGHLRDVLYYGGKYLDKVMQISFLEFVSALQIRLTLHFPDMFVFGVASHLAAAVTRVMQYVQTLLINILLPRPSRLSNVTFMVELFSTTPIFEELDLAVEGSGNLLEWLINTIVRGVEEIFRNDDDEIPELLSDADSRAVANVYKHALKLILAVPHLVLDATTGILWLNVITQTQSFSDSLKQFDGNWYDDNSCEARVARNESCSCVLERDNYHPFCKNPTLQADIFYNIEAVLDNLAFFGFDFMRPASALLRLPLQTLRVALRGLYYFDDIVQKEFFQYHRNHKDNPYDDQERCLTENMPECEFNPLLPAGDAVCMFSYPDDLISENPAVLQKFYDSSDHWCNSLLIEFVMRELDNIADVFTDTLTAFSECESYEVNELYSDHNIMCAAATAIHAITRVPLNLFRQFNSEFIGILAIKSASDGFFNTHMDTVNRFLDGERALFATLGTLTGGFPAPFDKVAANVAYSITSLPFYAARGAYYAVLFLRGAVYNAAYGTEVDWGTYVADCDTCIGPISSVPDGAIGLLYVEFRLVYVYIIQVLEALSGIQKEFFEAFIKIANVAVEAFSEALMEMVVLLLKVGTDLLNFFATGEISGMEFLNDLVTLFKKATTLLARVAMKILGAILDMLGPLGSFLRTFLSVVCQSLYSILCGITSFLGMGDTFCDDDACLSRNSMKAEDHPFNHVPKDIANLGWHDDSRCDRIVNSYQDYLWGDLRPIEQIELRECAEQRYIAMAMSKEIGVELPVDMLYNWKRKFEMAFHGSMGALLYIRHLMGESSVHFKHQWDQWDIPDYWLDLFRMTHQIQEFEFPMDAIMDTFRGEKGSASDVLIKMVHATNHTWSTARTILKAQPEFDWNVTFPDYTLGSSMAQRTRHTIDYAWDIQTDIETVGPTECAVLDNTITMFEMQTNIVISYYRDIYIPVTVPHFVSYLEYDDPWVEDFTITVLNTTVDLPDFYDIDVPGIEFTDVDSLNAKSSCQPVSEDTFTYVAELFECFITGTGDERLPYVGHNLEYYLKYQFRTCKYEQITCTDNISKRVDRMMEAIIACLWTTLVFIGLQYLIKFPIGVFTVLILAIYVLIFVTHVWNFTIFCYPNLPVCMLDDFFAFTERYLIPKCMCEYFPSLADGCIRPQCLFISQTTPWQVCEVRIAELYGGDHFNILWSPYMLAREYVPDLLRALHYFPPLYQSETFSIWMERVIQDIPISPLERDCIQFHYLNNVVVLVAVLVGFCFVSTIASTVLKVALIPVKVIPSACTLLYSMLVSMDQQTVGNRKQAARAPPPPPPTPKPTKLRRRATAADYKSIRI